MNTQTRPPEPAQRVLTLVLDAGKTLLENGGEVFRAQQTMEIMARALGLENFNVYVLTNGIFASAGAEPLNEVRHIPTVSVHLARVEAVNELSRELSAGKLSLGQAERRLREIRSIPMSFLWGDALAGALGSACFAWLFGANFAALPVAFAAGGAEVLLLRFFERQHVSRIFTDIVAAAACTAIALLCRAALPAVDASGAIIGALMVLTPGVALVMGVRDFINADYLSGAIRVIDALLIAGCLAFGVGAVYTLARSVWGVRL